MTTPSATEATGTAGRRAGRLPSGSRALSIGSLVGQAVAAVGMLVAVRHFDAADFGALGVFAAVAIVIGTLGTGRLEAAIPIPGRDGRALAIATLAALLLVPVVAIACGLAFAAAPFIPPSPDLPPIADRIPALAIGGLGVGVRSILLGWTTRRRAVRTIATARAANGVVTGTTMAIGALVRPELDLLLAAWIGGQWIEAIVLLVGSGRDPAVCTARRSRLGLGRTWRRYRRFPRVLLWGHLLDQTMNHLPTVTLATAYSVEVAGVFVVVHRIVIQPAAILGSAVSVALLSEAAARARARGSFRPVLDAALVRLLATTAAIFVPLAIAGPWLLPIAVGPELESSGLVLLAILPAAAADLVAMPVLPLLGLLERLATQTTGSLCRAAIIVGTLTAGAVAGLGPIAAIAVMAVSTVMLDAVLVQATRHAAGRGTSASIS